MSVKETRIKILKKWIKDLEDEIKEHEEEIRGLKNGT